MDVKEALADIDDEVARFFRELGFEVTWDFSLKDNQRWYEVYLGEALLAQINIGPPLAHILEDLPLMAEGKPGTSASDYTVYAQQETLKTLVRLISEKKGPPPWHA